jgi:glycosyltransferase involved in cell wall biosynthesis
MRISIVTISLNQAQFLPTTLASTVGQLGRDDEYVVVDPGSSDGSRRIISEHASVDQRIKPLFQADSGPADGLNQGFAQTTGDILAYINADDFLLSGALPFVRRFFSTHPNVDVLIGSIKIARPNGKTWLRGRVADRPTLPRLAAGVFQYYQQGTFFRRECFSRSGGFNPENRTCWDRELIIDLALGGARIAVSSRPLGAFRIHPASITGSARSNDRYILDIKRLQQKIREQIEMQASPFATRILKFEAKANPFRWLLQLRPLL